MAVGVESEEVAKGLDGDDGAGDGIPFWNRRPKKEFQGFPGASAQIGKQNPVIEEIPAQDLRDAEAPWATSQERTGCPRGPFYDINHWAGWERFLF
jgi:hypothetical protein